MIVPSSLRFANRCVLWLATAATFALTLWTGAVARAQSDPPSITAHPQSLTVTQGMAASFTVTAVGTEPLVYQWFRNTNNVLTGATNSTLILSNGKPSTSPRLNRSR